MSKQSQEQQHLQTQEQIQKQGQKEQQEQKEEKEDGIIICQYRISNQKTQETDLQNHNQAQICGDQEKRDQRHKCKQCCLTFCKIHLGMHKSQEHSCEEQTKLRKNSQQNSINETKASHLQTNTSQGHMKKKNQNNAQIAAQKENFKPQLQQAATIKERQLPLSASQLAKPWDYQDISSISIGSNIQNQTDVTLQVFAPSNKTATAAGEDNGQFPSLDQDASKSKALNKNYEYKPMPKAHQNTDQNMIASIGAKAQVLQEVLQEHQQRDQEAPQQAENVLNTDLFSKIFNSPQDFAKQFSWNDPARCVFTREKEVEKKCEHCGEVFLISKHVCRNFVSEDLNDDYFIIKQKGQKQLSQQQQSYQYGYEEFENKLINDRVKCTREIAGYKIKFPYQTYKIQEDFMRNILAALQLGSHCIQEMPTGTGKTLCLLSSLLAYQQIRKQSWQILYVSRTHTQVKQIVRELKQKACYVPKMTVLGAKEKMCINQTIIERAHTGDKPLNTLCKQAQVGEIQSCSYYKSQGELEKKIEILQPSKQIMDIEELQNFGLEHQICPYLLSKNLISDADIIFTVYAYALSPGIIKHLMDQASENRRNLIIVYDEAHNVPEQAEQFISKSIEEKTIEDCVQFCENIESFLANVRTDIIQKGGWYGQKNIDELERKFESCRDCTKSLYALARQLKTSLTDAKWQNGLLKADRYRDNNDLDERKWLVSEDEAQIIRLLGTKYHQFDRDHKIDKKIKQLIEVLQLYPFQRFYNFISAMNEFREIIQLASQNCRVFKLLLVRNSNQNYSLFLRCFDAALVFDALKQKNRIILTSGSLSPLNNFEDELDVQFSIQKSIPHIISPQKIADHVRVKVISHGLDGQTPLNFMHKFLYQKQGRGFSDEGNQIVRQLGLTLLHHIRGIPNGVVIFFSSKAILQKCRKYWQNCSWDGSKFTIYDQLEQLKEIYIEPATQRDIVPVFTEYKREAMTERGALLMAVCRGRLAEGIDFKDELARAIFIVAVPNLSYVDIEIKLKKKFLEKRQTGLGEQWYESQTQRAINQAAGRILRHDKDYGAVFLVDQRFVLQQDRFKNGLSEWMRSTWDEVKNHDKAHQEILQFIQHNKNKGLSSCDNKEDPLFAQNNDLAMEDDLQGDAYPRQEERQRRIYKSYLTPSDAINQLQKGLIYEGIFSAFDRIDYFASVRLTHPSQHNREVKIVSRISQNRAMHGAKVIITLTKVFGRIVKRLQKDLQKFLEVLIITQDLKEIMRHLQLVVSFENHYQGATNFDYLRGQTLKFLRVCEETVPATAQFKELRNIFRKYARQIEFLEMEGEVVGILSCPYNNQSILNGVVRRDYLTQDERYWFFPFNPKLPKLAISNNRFGELEEHKIKRSLEEELYASNYFQANIIEWGKQQMFPQIKIGLGEPIHCAPNTMKCYEHLLMQDQGLECLIDRRQDQILFENNTKQYKELIKAEVDRRLADEKFNLTGHEYEYTVTVDDKETVTRDDAFTLIPSQEDAEGATLLVHISDITSVLQENKPLEKLARQRVSNIYFKNYRYSMLPEDFCELFSINPKENRLAVTLVFKITKNKIKFVEYFRSVIKSRVALSYENAQSLTKQAKNDQQVPQWFLQEKLEKISFRQLQEQFKLLSDSLLNYRQRKIQKHGAFEFDEILEPDDFEAHNLIKMLMTKCNRRVAKILCKRYPQQAFVRSCAVANRYRLQQLSDLFDQMEMPFDYSSARTLRHCIDEALKKETPQSYALQNVLHWFNSMSQYTLYERYNTHFAMGDSPYTQFTSPIRRYADLLAHRQLFAQSDEEARLPEGIADEVNQMVDKIKRVEKLARRQSYYSQVTSELQRVKSLRAIAMHLSQKQIKIVLLRDTKNIDCNDRKSLPSAVVFDDELLNDFIVYVSQDSQNMHFLYKDQEINDHLNDFQIRIRQAEAEQKIELAIEYKEKLQNLLGRYTVFKLCIYQEFWVEVKTEGTFPYDGFLRVKQQGQFDEQRKMERQRIMHQIQQQRQREEEERKKKKDERKKLFDKQRKGMQDEERREDSQTEEEEEDSSCENSE